MTATMNPGAETIRIDRSYMPLLMQLKTSGAVGANPATDAALSRLEAGDLVRCGRLHPMADAIFEVVAEPALVVSIERMRVGAVAASTIWATPGGAVVGARVERGLFELKLASPALLPFHILQLIHLRPLPAGGAFTHVVPADVLLDAEALLDNSNRAAAATRLGAAGVVGADDIVELMAARIASWRIHSMWTDGSRPQAAEASGMDCGSRGHVLVTIGPDRPELTLRAATFDEVLRAVRATLPPGR